MKKNKRIKIKNIRKYIGILFVLFSVISILWTYFFVKNNIYTIMTSDIIQWSDDTSQIDTTTNKLEELLTKMEEKNNIIKEKSSTQNIIYKNIFK